MSVSGLVAVELSTGELHTLAAKAVLFATGGFGRMFKITSNAYANTGDGPAVCARRGIPLDGHGVLPVSSDRHHGAGHPDF
jgi:succinate dehydrogenase / fumarate reductase flavoprotein subunit